MVNRVLAGLATALLVAGCASRVPEAIREPVPRSPEPAEVRKEPGAHVGAQIRWGGTVAAVHNRQAHTRLEVVARPLASQGRPRPEAASAGRFLAEVEGFLDPAVYSQGRRVTVTGRLAEPETHPIGDYPYRFPVVQVREHYLWPQDKPERSPKPRYWYRDHWYPYYGPHHPYWYP
ncbi:Slp family lipoprotein [Thiohalorhabdus sp.]|uniref:Slp family lipoprotein n=1 Tax=Thiohalorhabdus sp. TaxID=3094134 RepID=UPI002FC39AB3